MNDWPTCAMNAWPWYVVILAGVMVVGLGVVCLLVFDLVRKQYHRELTAQKEAVITYPEAWEIVRSYIDEPIQNMGLMRGGMVWSAAYEILDRFSHTPGAMPFKGLYHRQRLYEWIQMNVADFLVTYEADMKGRP